MPTWYMETIMLSREGAIRDIFEKHGDKAVYVCPTGYISRAVFSIFPKNQNIFYMQGSMGLSPGIGLGISFFTKKEVVVLSGDASLLMHLGITHTLRDNNKTNLFFYVLDNGCHESVGRQTCSSLESKYCSVDKIYKISCDGKTDRVGVSFFENANTVKKILEDGE